MSYMVSKRGGSSIVWFLEPHGVRFCFAAFSLTNGRISTLEKLVSTPAITASEWFRVGYLFTCILLIDATQRTPWKVSQYLRTYSNPQTLFPELIGEVLRQTNPDEYIQQKRAITWLMEHVGKRICPDDSWIRIADLEST
jgi:hypothetical protein